MDLYFDDLIVVHKDPGHLFDSVIVNEFIIKETSAPDYFLGGYFEHVKEPKTDNEIMTWGYNTYVKRLM